MKIKDFSFSHTFQIKNIKSNYLNNSNEPKKNHNYDLIIIILINSIELNIDSYHRMLKKMLKPSNVQRNYVL